MVFCPDNNLKTKTSWNIYMFLRKMILKNTGGMGKVSHRKLDYAATALQSCGIFEQKILAGEGSDMKKNVWVLLLVIAMFVT